MKKVMEMPAASAPPSEVEAVRDSVRRAEEEWRDLTIREEAKGREVRRLRTELAKLLCPFQSGDCIRVGRAAPWGIKVWMVDSVCRPDFPYPENEWAVLAINVKADGGRGSRREKFTSFHGLELEQAAS